MEMKQVPPLVCEIKEGKKYGTLHDFACHPCAGAMLIFSVLFQVFFTTQSLLKRRIGQKRVSADYLICCTNHQKNENNKFRKFVSPCSLVTLKEKAVI